MSKASLELGGTNWAAKDGNLLGYANGSFVDRYVPREFTFSRGSNLSATLVDSNGLIEKGRENLLLQSNNFDTTWTDELLGSIISGQSGYDGTNDAWLLNKGEYQYRRILQSLSTSVSGIWTFSVYAKEGTTSIMNLRDMINANRVQFDLSGSGSVSAEFGNISSKIESVGNGWFRCSATFNGTSSSVGIYVGWNDSTASNIYIQDAQLEQGLVATEYIESGATTGKAGLLENEPRIDYTDGTPSLLLEPQRVNLFNYSEYASGNTLTGSPIITENYAISPEGLSNAFRIQDTTGGTFKRIATAFSVSANSTYTQSLFVKKATSPVSTFGGIGFDYSGGTREISYVIFDEYNGTMTALQSQSTLTLHDAEDYGDYWRFSVSATDTGSNNYQSINIYACLSATGISVTAGTKDYTAYGLQVEEGSYPTSYIPNHSGGSATRTADSQTLDITNFVSATEGTLFFELKDARSHSATNKILGIGDGSGVDNFFGLYVSNFATGAVGIRNRQANADLMNTAIPNPQNAKVAIKFGADGVKTFLNGSEFQSSATAYTGWATSFDLNTTVGDVDLKQYLLFPEALSDSDCITLTT